MTARTTILTCLTALILTLGAPGVALAQTEPRGGESETAAVILAYGIDYGTKAIGVLIILVVGLILAGWLRRLTVRTCERAKLDLTLAKFFAGMVRWAVLLVVALFCLGTFGVNITGFAAILAAAGFAVGLALQGTLANFSSGVMLLIFRPFKVGDVVNVAGVVGKVNEIQLFTTVLDTPDNRRVIVPNGVVFGSTIENITHHPTRRVEVAVGTEYTADLDRVRDVLRCAAEGVNGRLPSEDVAIVLSQLGASSIDWSVRVWAKTGDYGSVREELTRDVKIALDAAGVGIPFAQMDVHFDQPMVA